jgi:pSer/pThr/pTyr-binding forkhead associated (FHA) protein
MGVLLEIKTGALAGKNVVVLTAQTLTFGRAEGRSEVALPQDTFMSGLHFAVECGISGCRVVDRKSSNGTFLNGARIQDAMLANGDEIKAGQTVFAVRIVPDEKLAGSMSSQPADAPPRTSKPASVSPSSGPRDLLEAQSAGPNVAAEPAPPRTGQRVTRVPEATPGVKSGPPARSPVRDASIPSAPASSATPAASANASTGANAEQRPSAPFSGAERSASKARDFAVSMMGWSFRAVPAKWQVQEGLGLQSEEGEFPSSLAATQESLGGITLQQFVEFQINMLKGYLREAKIEPALPPRVSGAAETMAVDVRHKTKDGTELVYRRIYARSAAAVGVLTVTALASEMEQVLQRLQPALQGAEFQANK